MEPAAKNVSNAVCPSPQSHGLYRLKGTSHAMPCALSDTWACVHPAERDALISRGIIWKGRWVMDCNEGYRIRTLCAIIETVRTAREEPGGHSRSLWVLDVGANIGTFTLPLLEAGVNVLSFEADADNAALLRGSVEAQRRMRGVREGQLVPTGAQVAAAPPLPLGASVIVEGVLAATAGNEVCLGRAEAANSGSVRVRAINPSAGTGGEWPSAGGPESLQDGRPTEAAVVGAVGASAPTPSSSVAAASTACVRPQRTTTLDLELARHVRRMARVRSLNKASAVPGGAVAAEGAVTFVVVKMDVQGYEAEVLAGASRLLSEASPAVMHLETQNTTLVRRLESEHGYVSRGKHKDGCDYNVRLERGRYAVPWPAGRAGVRARPSQDQEEERWREHEQQSGQEPASARPRANGDVLERAHATPRHYVDMEGDGSAADGHEASPANATLEVVNRYRAACQQEAHSLPEDMAAWVASHEATGSVPRLLHQTWKTCELPERQRGWWVRCSQLSPGWRMRLWTDAANRAFVSSALPALSESLRATCPCAPATPLHTISGLRDCDPCAYSHTAACGQSITFDAEPRDTRPPHTGGASLSRAAGNVRCLPEQHQARRCSKPCTLPLDDVYI